MDTNLSSTTQASSIEEAYESMPEFHPTPFPTLAPEVKPSSETSSTIPPVPLPSWKPRPETQNTFNANYQEEVSKPLNRELAPDISQCSITNKEDISNDTNDGIVESGNVKKVILLIL